MRTTTASILALIVTMGATVAAPSAWSQSGPLPRAFAGYAQPAIPASACKALGPAETDCVIPAMTAGRYLVQAAGTSTAPAAGANQALEIDVGARQCGVGRDTEPWKAGPRTFRLDCEVTLLTDAPVVVRVIYADAQATKDPRGPSVAIRPLAWTGVLTSQAFAPPQ